MFRSEVKQPWGELSTEEMTTFVWILMCLSVENFKKYDASRGEMPTAPKDKMSRARWLEIYENLRFDPKYLADSVMENFKTLKQRGFKQETDQMSF